MKTKLLLLSLFFAGCSCSSSVETTHTESDSLYINYFLKYIPVESKRLLLEYYLRSGRIETFYNKDSTASVEIDRTDPNNPKANITTPKDSVQTAIPQITREKKSETIKSILPNEPSWIERQLRTLLIYGLLIVALIIAFRRAIQ